MTITEGFLAPVGNKIVRSRNGRAWTSIPTPKSYDAAVWVGRIGRWVLAGDGIATSPDTQVWTTKTVPTSNRLLAVIAAEPLGLIIAAGENGTLITSSDGDDWTARSPGVGSSRITHLAYSPVAQLVVAVTDDGKIGSSPDALTWTTRSLGVNFANPSQLVWSDLEAAFLVVANTATFPSNPVTRKSSNAASWTHFDVGNPNDPSWWIPYPRFVSPEKPGMLVALGSGRVAFTMGNGIWSFYTLTDAPVGAGAYSAALELYVSGALGLPWASGLSTWTSGVFDGAPVGAMVVAVGPVAVSAPYAPTPTAPTGTVNKDATTRFSWGFASPETGDQQTGFQVRYRTTGGSWVTVSGETPNRFWDAPPGEFGAGDYEWQIRVSGELGDWSPWSASQFFTAVPAPPGPVVVAPIVDGTIGDGTFLVEWSTATQNSYQLRRVADNGGSPNLAEILWDTGEIVSVSARSHLAEFPVNNQTEHLQLRIKNAGLWTSWVSVRVHVAYTPPSTPTLTATVFTVGTAALEAGLRYTIATPPPEPGAPAATSVEIWRRVKGEPGNGTRVAKNLAPNSFFDDWAVASGVEYEIRARAFGENGTATWSGWLQDTIGYLALPDGGFVELVGW